MTSLSFSSSFFRAFDVLTKPACPAHGLHMFYSVQVRLEKLAANETGAFMVVIQLADKGNDNVQKPFRTILDLPSTALASTLAVHSDEMLSTGRRCHELGERL